MSLFLGKTTTGVAKLHITSDTRDKEYLETQNGITSLFNTGNGYIALSHVETISPVATTDACYSHSNNYYHYLSYTPTVDLWDSSKFYIAVGRDAYTNVPIIYKEFLNLYENFWVYQTGTVKGDYGLSGCGVFLYYLGNSSSFNPDYTAPTYLPDIDIYEMTLVNLSVYNEILVGNSNITLSNSTDSTNIITLSLIGVGELANTNDLYEVVENSTDFFQILAINSVELELNSDKIIGKTSLGTSYEIFGTSSSTLLTNKVNTAYTGYFYTKTFTIPANSLTLIRFNYQDSFDGSFSQTGINNDLPMMVLVSPNSSTTTISKFTIVLDSAGSIFANVLIRYRMVDSSTCVLEIVDDPDISGDDTSVIQSLEYCRLANISSIQLST